LEDNQKNNTNTIFPNTIDSFFFRKAWEIFSDNWSFILKLILITALFVTIINMLLIERILPEINLDYEQDLSSMFNYLITLQLYSFIANIILLVPKSYFLLIFIILLPLMYENKEIGFADLGMFNVGLFIKFYMYSLMILLLEAIGIMMCVVPGILVVIQFAFLQFAFLLETPPRLFARTFELINGYRVQILSIYMLYFFILTALSFILLPFFSTDQPAVEPAGGFSVFDFVFDYVNQIVVAGLTYFVTVLFFQVYMMSRIVRGEIEVVEK